ncbi:MAG: 4-hydroxybenzoate solanesyltransferase [Spirulina sp. SIO3F2]|nr:4-hydroxybenzoate solanesyltransferase [Spirulina sp. SIO3F2]
MTSTQTWSAIVQLLRWNHPAGRLILMLPALWAVVMAAKGQPPLPLIVVIVLGSIATSAAGCVANDLWDRNIDPQVERTKARPLASRALSVQVGIAVGLVALTCAAGLAFYLNPLSFGLCVAAVPFILLYPSAKRFFPIPQLVLSLTWGFAVLISWTAVTGAIASITWLLWGAVVCWTLGFDTVYALSDREDDIQVGVNSSARFFGAFAPHFVGVCFAVTAALLGAVAYLEQLNGSFWVMWLLAVVGWGLQTRRLLQPELPRSAYGKIFAQNVWLGSAILVGLITGYLPII